jgi:cell wall-associated NlpC family hydrolase
VKPALRIGLLVVVCVVALTISATVAVGRAATARITGHRTPGQVPNPAPLVFHRSPATKRLIRGRKVVRIARRYLGVPYRWGGISPSGFDCSGLVAYAYSRLGVSLPHSAAAQYGLGFGVPVALLQPGDLVFFSGLGHVGIAVGSGRYIHAPQTGERVEISSLASRAGSIVGARRLW